MVEGLVRKMISMRVQRTLKKVNCYVGQEDFLSFLDNIRLRKKEFFKKKMVTVVINK